MIELFFGEMTFDSFGIPGNTSPLVNRTCTDRIFCKHRNGPVAPYDQIIADYGRLPEADKRVVERVVDSYLTIDEMSELIDDIWRHTKLRMRAREVHIPVVFNPEMREVEYGVNRWLFEEQGDKPAVRDGALLADKGIALIWVKDADTSSAYIYLTPEQEHAATELVTSVLNALHVPVPEGLRWLVNSVCGKQGLIVVPERDEKGASKLEVRREATAEAWACGYASLPLSIEDYPIA